MKKGKVFFIGAGPYPPDLITVRGFNILKQADVIVYDYLLDKNILGFAKKDALLISTDELPGGRYSDGSSKNQKAINDVLIKKASEGKSVVRLKNGDPSIFGRLCEELSALKDEGINFAVIPGVTAASAAAAFSGIPLTARGISSALVLTTGHESPGKKDGYVNWKNVAVLDTISLYMSHENLFALSNILIDCGKPPSTPSAVISRVGSYEQKIVTGTLRDIAKKARKNNLESPAIFVVGEVVKKEKEFNWFKKTKKSLFTGISDERYFEEKLYFHIPLIEIKPLDDYAELDNWIKKISNSHKRTTINPIKSYTTMYKDKKEPSASNSQSQNTSNGVNYKPFFDWLVFTSRFGVYYFFDRLLKSGSDARSLNGIKIAAIGSSTANKLKEYGIIADLVPKNECSEGLLEEFKNVIRSTFKVQSSIKILLPRSDIADKGLSDGLRELGAEVFSCVAYRNVMPKDLPDIDFSFFDEIIFSSPSCVGNFIKRYGCLPPGKVKIKSIGPVTKKECEKYGISVK